MELSMEQRRAAIVELVNQKGSVSFAQLKEAFPSVSEMTLRTDLKALDSARSLVRVHGGAKSVQVIVGTDDQLGRRIARNADAKLSIAQKAVQLLRPNMTVYLDSGSTATTLARNFPDDPYLIFTSGLSCVTELARLTTARVMIPGGILNRYSMSVCGIQSIQDVQRVNFDLMFLGVTSYSTDTGFTCGVEEESQLKRTALHRSEQVAVLMDSSKVGIKSSFSICGLADVNYIISDGRLPESFLHECRQYGVTVL